MRCVQLGAETDRCTKGGVCPIIQFASEIYWTTSRNNCGETVTLTHSLTYTHAQTHSHTHANKRK